MTTTAHKAHNSYSTAYKPSIDYAKASRSYFVYNGVQSVKQCPASTFKAAILQALGDKKLPDDCKKIMDSDEMVMRWFLLNTLEELKTPLKLYSCFDDCDDAYYKSLV